MAFSEYMNFSSKQIWEPLKYATRFGNKNLRALKSYLVKKTTNVDKIWVRLVKNDVRSRLYLTNSRAVGRSENPEVPVVMWWA